MIARLAGVLVAVLAACGPTQLDSGGDDDPNDPNDPNNPGPDADCPAANFTAQPLVPSISLLIDRSQSMTNSIGGKSRYNAVRDALIDPATGVVTQLQARAHFGASLYSTDSPCPRLYSVPRALNNRDAIAQLIGSQSPDGDTPTGPSIDRAVADFVAAPPPADSPPVIVLATDGLPNGCNGGNGEQASIDAAARSFAAGIRLFVLAVGNGINDDHLQAVANAGAGAQDAPFFVANTPDDLRAAFDTIISGVASCELQIDGTIDEAQAAAGSVTLNGRPLQFGVDWDLVDGNVIRLRDQACNELKSAANPSVQASFPCGAVIL